jgi:hypothetical protein
MTHTSSFHQNAFVLFTLPPFFLSALLHYSLHARLHTNLTAYLHFSAPRFAWPPFILLLLPVWSGNIPRPPSICHCRRASTHSFAPCPHGPHWHDMAWRGRRSFFRVTATGWMEKYMHDGAYFQ